MNINGMHVRRACHSIVLTTNSDFLGTAGKATTDYGYKSLFGSVWVHLLALIVRRNSNYLEMIHDIGLSDSAS